MGAAGIVVAGFIGLTIWLLAPLSTSPGSLLYDSNTFRSWFFNQPDVYLNAWILAWDAHVLASGELGATRSDEDALAQ